VSAGDVGLHARRAARSRWVGYLGRAGLAAQGAAFGLIGGLAVALALGAGGKATDPQGAFETLARTSWSKTLLVLVAAGLACYSVWRFAQALFDRGGMGSDAGGLGRRAIQLGQGLVYALLTFSAVRVLLGSQPQSGGAQRTAGGVLGWPGGRFLVGAAALGFFVGAGVTGYWALSGRFMESLETGRMSRPQERLARVLGTAGLLALAVVAAIIGWFLLRAAVEYDPQDAVGIGGALARLAEAGYGKLLLGIVAAGLVVFAAFDAIQARFHRA
jgi:hypothetical protein